MDEQTIVKTLTENGGKLWEKNNMRRIYFNPETVLDMDISYYKTGNISGATANGERISNSEARRALACKVWYDITSGEFHTKNVDSLRKSNRVAAADFIDELKSKIS